MITENDCYLASKEEQDKLVETVLAGGKLNRKCVGRDAKTLLSMIGVQAPANTRCIIFEGPKEHPLITTELMMPIRSEEHTLNSSHIEESRMPSSA